MWEVGWVFWYIFNDGETVVKRLREVLKAIQWIIYKAKIIPLNTLAFISVSSHLVHTACKKDQSNVNRLINTILSHL